MTRPRHATHGISFPFLSSPSPSPISARSRVPSSGRVASVASPAFSTGSRRGGGGSSSSSSSLGLCSPSRLLMTTSKEAARRGPFTNLINPTELGAAALVFTGQVFNRSASRFACALVLNCYFVREGETRRASLSSTTEGNIMSFGFFFFFFLMRSFTGSPSTLFTSLEIADGYSSLYRINRPFLKFIRRSRRV